MLRALIAFLLVFCLLSLVVQLDGMVRLFGAIALALLAVDSIVHSVKTPRTPRMRGEPLG